MDDPIKLDDGNQIRIKDAIDASIKEVFGLLHSASGIQSHAMSAMANHISANWKALLILDERSGAEAELLSHSKAILMRSMFDVYLQFEYLVQADTKNRAKLYLDYKEVERYQRVAKTIKRDDAIAKHVASSPLRSMGEPALKARYDAIVSAYTNPKGIVRNQWYPQGNLGNLSNEVGKNDEYFYFTQRYNSSVHGGPLAACEGTPGDDFMVFSGAVMCRVLGHVVGHFRFSVSNATKSMIDAFTKISLTDF